MPWDLHTHSVCSDGTDAPGALLGLAAETGLAGIALTDHDTTAGWEEAADAAESLGVGLLRGAEISCHVRGVTVHLLSYLHDPTEPALAAAMARTRASRLGRAERMVENLAADYPIAWADVTAQASRDATIGRPHIADALRARGVVGSREEAFATMLSPRSKYYVPHFSIEAVEAINLVRGAGGVPVFAHPGAELRGRIVDDEAISAMADAGLAGLEIQHRDNPAPQRARLVALAAEYDLLVTGASDFHGAGKPNRMGENATDTATVLAIVAQGRGSEAIGL